MKLFTQDNFGGNGLVIEGPASLNLKDSYPSFDGKVSSMIVVKSYSFKVTGEWKVE